MQFHDVQPKSAWVSSSTLKQWRMRPEVVFGTLLGCRAWKRRLELVQDENPQKRAPGDVFGDFRWEWSLPPSSVGPKEDVDLASEQCRCRRWGATRTVRTSGRRDVL